MKMYRVARLLAVAAQITTLVGSPALTRTQSQATPPVQSPATAGTQSDPYAAAFTGLTYSDAQKEAIGKIRQDIAARKEAVVNDHKLTPEQKDGMLSGYTRMQYSLIFKELTPAQKKLVSTRIHSSHAAEQNGATK